MPSNLEAGHQLGQGHHVGVSLHFTVTQVELAKQQGRRQGAVETGIGGDDPLQGAHLRDERREGIELEVVKFELTAEQTATGGLPDQQIGIDIADLLGGKIEANGRLLPLEIQGQSQLLIVGLEAIGHKRARRGAHHRMQGRLIATPAGTPIGGEHRLPAEVVRQPGAQPLEIKLAQGKLQSPLRSGDLTPLDAEAGPLGAEAEIPIASR